MGPGSPFGWSDDYWGITDADLAGHGVLEAWEALEALEKGAQATCVINKVGIGQGG